MVRGSKAQRPVTAAGVPQQQGEDFTDGRLPGAGIAMVLLAARIWQSAAQPAARNLDPVPEPVSSI